MASHQESSSNSTKKEPKGDSQKQPSQDEEDADEAEEMPSDDPEENNEMTTEPMIPMEEPKEIGPMKGECKEKLDYDPTAIGCAFPENTSNSVWKNEEYWNNLINMMSNKAAAWMAPSKASKKGANLDYCPSMVGTNKLVYVTNFKLDSTTKIIVEAVMDDEGVIEIWKNADSKQKVYSIDKATNNSVGEVTLDKGFYNLITSTTDNGASATGYMGSVVNAETKAVIKQTEGKDWCIFKMQKEVGTEEFLNSHALCMSCMVGTDASQ